MEDLRRHTLLRGLLLGVFLVLILLPIGGYLYLRYDPMPVATGDTPSPDEEQIVHIPLDARINRQLATAPFSETPENLTSGAHVFVQNCAVCHGTPVRASDLAKAMYRVAQLWIKDVNGVVASARMRREYRSGKLRMVSASRGCPRSNTFCPTPKYGRQPFFFMKQDIP